MRLLLDSHISPAVARALRQGGLDALSIHEWYDGSYRDSPDALILAAAHSDGRVFVTYDCRTVPELLRAWAESSREHAGVVLVDDQTVPPSDLGGLVRALRALVDQRGHQGWIDQVVFLRAR